MDNEEIEKYKTLKPQNLFDNIDVKDKSEKLAILGTAPISKTIEELKEDGYEIWMCGVDHREGGDRYFEFHGLEVKSGRNVYRNYPDYLYKSPVPLNNSLSNMLMIAYHEGYKNIKVMGAPMSIKSEYIYQARGMSMVIGYLIAKGLNVKWTEGPHHTFYGSKEFARTIQRNRK